MHPYVGEIIAFYEVLVDAALPGFVEGLYLIGSTALDDFYLDRSDVDFVAVSAMSPDLDQVATLELVHAQLSGRYPRPGFDGPYVTWAELAAPPAEAAPGPHAHAGNLRYQVNARRHPVAWHTLASHGVALRGPSAQDLQVHTDRDQLISWTADNLDIYWRPWWGRSSQLASPSGLACLGRWGPAWGVLGVSRMHYTVATGQIASQRAAGEYARAAFDHRWRRIIDECLRIRRGQEHRSLYRSPYTRRIHALDFVDMAIADTHRIAHR